ncbi:hypothetical protein ACUTGA_23630 [Escherichia coli]
MGTSSWYFDTTAKAYAYSYALGAAQGNTLNLHFNKAVDKTTQWKVPLGITITYS